MVPAPGLPCGCCRPGVVPLPVGLDDPDERRRLIREATRQRKQHPDEGLAAMLALPRLSPGYVWQDVVVTSTGPSASPPSTATALGAFAGLGTFGSFLEDCGNDDNLKNRRFPARNFRLDPQVSTDAADKYLGNPAVMFTDTDDWTRHHNKFFETHMARPRPALGAPRFVDPITGIWPLTFSQPGSFRSLGAADQDLSLIRVEDATRIARTASVAISDLLGWAAASAAGTASRLQDNLLQSALDEWQSRSDLRPVFAAFWEGLDDILPDSSKDAPPDWPNSLRDRLGLYHYDARGLGRSIPIIVMQYPIKTVPQHAGSSSARAVVRPSVLDGRLSEAFCPAPASSRDGCTVDLAARLEQPSLEVVHAANWFTTQHVFRVGTITNGVPADLSDSRQAHLMWLRQWIADFADGTDSDLV